jgi:hypothetical protein
MSGFKGHYTEIYSIPLIFKNLGNLYRGLQKFALVMNDSFSKEKGIAIG